jgi:flagellar basal-body rod protein FlgB
MSLVDLITNRTELPTLKSSMDAFALRQKVIANNIANAQTPGYARKEVSFEENFRKALESQNNKANHTRYNHLSKGREPLYVKSTITEEKLAEGEMPFDNGINNVDMEREMTDLAKTQLDFDAMTKLVKKHLTLLRSAIRGSGG